MMDDIIRTARESYEEAKSAINAWNEEATVDMRFYLSDQWDDKDAEALRKKGVPVLNLNYIKKTVDLVTGFQRQNRSDLKYYPIENGDQLVSEMLSRIALWVMRSNNSRYYVSEAFKDAAIMGLGWFYPVLDFSKDPVNGDVFLRKESPFNMLFDPYVTEIDFSDCSYIIRHKLLHERKASELWPEHKDEIKRVSGAKGDNSFRQDADVPSDKGNMVLVMEYWYRTNKSVDFAVDQLGNFTELENEEDKAAAEESEEFEVITKKMPTIKVAIMVGENSKDTKPVLVYHDESPYSTSDFHFIPVFGYLATSYSYWKDKLQGLIRPLRDPQREKNKRRSQIMHIMNTVASSGYDVEKGAYDDINQFSKGGAGKIFERNRGFNPAQRIQPPDMPVSVVQLEQLFSSDINMIGANPDLLGQMSEKGAAGITIQLRQKQGMTALQEIFDNLSMALTRFGRMLVELIIDNFSQTKVERILGDDVPYKKEIAQLSEQMEQIRAQLEQGALDLKEMAGRQTSDEEQFQAMEQEEQMLQQQLMQMQVQYQQMQQKIQMLEAKSQEFWAKWGDLGKNSRYDCSVSEAIESETYRISTLSALLQAQQYGIPIPPMLLNQYLDIPMEDKQATIDYMNMQQQQAMELQQQKMSLEEKKLQDQKEIELIKQGVFNKPEVSTLQN